MTGVEVRRAADRFCTRTDWLTSWHSFSYGQWYDPDNIAFGPLAAFNHDVLAPGAGFDDHWHSGVDLVTYVVAGALEHRDSTGHAAVVRAGEVQVLRSGAGLTHSERNASATEPVEYVQMWLRTDNLQVSYVLPAMGDDSSPALLVALPAGILRRARLHGRGQRLGLPAGPAHAYVLSGAVALGDDELRAGDALRIVQGGVTLAATGDRAELLVWELLPTTGGTAQGHHRPDADPPR